jgi:hypothetical protein
LLIYCGEVAICETATSRGREATDAADCGGVPKFRHGNAALHRGTRRAVPSSRRVPIVMPRQMPPALLDVATAMMSAVARVTIAPDMT